MVQCNSYIYLFLAIHSLVALLFFFQLIIYSCFYFTFYFHISSHPFLNHLKILSYFKFQRVNLESSSLFKLLLFLYNFHLQTEFIFIIYIWIWKSYSNFLEQKFYLIIWIESFDLSWKFEFVSKDDLNEQNSHILNPRNSTIGRLKILS